MKKPRITKHRHGFNIMFTQHIFFSMNIDEWRFVPSIEFHRAAGLRHIFVFAFLCFELTFCRWRINK